MGRGSVSIGFDPEVILSRWLFWGNQFWWLGSENEPVKPINQWSLKWFLKTSFWLIKIKFDYFINYILLSTILTIVINKEK